MRDKARKSTLTTEFIQQEQVFALYELEPHILADD